MMDAPTIVFLVGTVACLFLALRALRSHGLSFENKAWMIVAWGLIITVLAYALVRLGL